MFYVCLGSFDGINIQDTDGLMGLKEMRMSYPGVRETIELR